MYLEALNKITLKCVYSHHSLSSQPSEIYGYLWSRWKSLYRRFRSDWNLKLSFWYLWRPPQCHSSGLLPYQQSTCRSYHCTTHALLIFRLTPPSLSSHLHVLPSSLLNCHMSPSNFSILISLFTMSTVHLLLPLKPASVCHYLLFSVCWIIYPLSPPPIPMNSWSQEILIFISINLMTTNYEVKKLTSALDSTNLTQSVSFPTQSDRYICWSLLLKMNV